MFIHNLKYTIKTLFKNKVLIFWTFAFPLLLGTFFTMAFSDIEKGETLDSLALDAYNNPTYFFLIADFNRIQDPFKPLEEGSQIKIPTFNSVNYEA